jgi:hypothetical protein
MPAVTTPTTIIHTGPGTYSSVPLQGTPTWAIVPLELAGLVVVILAAILLVLLRRRRHPRPGGGPDQGGTAPGGGQPGPRARDELVGTGRR